MARALMSVLLLGSTVGVAVALRPCVGCMEALDAPAWDEDLEVFVAKYRLGQVTPLFRVYHTAAVICPAADVDVGEVVEKMGPRKGSFRTAFRSEQPFTSKMRTCFEYEFAGDDGIETIAYSRSDFDRYDNGTKRVYYVGSTKQTELDRVLRLTQECGTTTVRGKALPLDYNKNTYNFFTHNCHTFTDLLLKLLLPGEPHPGLPSHFMPESVDKNPVRGRLAQNLGPRLFGHKNYSLSIRKSEHCEEPQQAARGARDASEAGDARQLARGGGDRDGD